MTLKHDLIERGAIELDLLNRLKRQGWEDPRLDQFFLEQRKIADTAGPDLNLMWFKRMRKVFKEIDTQTSCVSSSGPIEFLDLGCNPGGFTSYILNKNQAATGLGISLPVERGGHVFTLEMRLRTRFNLFEADLNQYQLGPVEAKGLTDLPSAISTGRTIDLAILDGHHLRKNLQADPWDIDVLLVSQIIIALQSVRLGGTMVIKLSRIDRVRTIKLMFMLDALSATLFTVKPVTMHNKRGSFYAVAQAVGFGLQGHEIGFFVAEFKKVWWELKFGGKDGKGRFMALSDLDFIITSDTLRCDKVQYLDRVIELGRDVWRIQTVALEKLLGQNKTRF
ncbi:hypothetical protein C8J56DRAFT_769900 [Mycena floridula]|nr:hypothetical protein C8J56DRAFT_769900 [Mycena floridula]